MLRITDPREYVTKAFLCDGTPVGIRAIRSGDKAKLTEHFHQLKAASRYQRFFGYRKALTPHELRHFTAPDFLSHVALVATVNEGTGLERLVGDSCYVVLPDRPAAAELALSVVDDYQRRGIGTILLDHLLRLAEQTAVQRLEADVLASNGVALRFFTRRGFTSSGTVSGVCRLALSIFARCSKSRIADVE
jgi:GNAT superfamily N-acetyltransferase